ncbi:MAG: rod shape-determining protein RodA [Stygiobacter sp.]|uniref:Peptidoglycan glycosyltransferase RodA n=1 Tax=Stygiobacter electus TaxID=3032292 RepID=A0AAE3TC43_9BACT|nr:rod shape-determining protein RodA [Stygiobacter electus]MDF1611101.1 rod shape-determining protein RodA [Stygiobacter electus]
MKIEYRLQDRFDFAVFIPVIGLIIFGLLAIYSSTVNHPVANGNFSKQLIFFVIGLFIFLIIYSLPQQTIKMFAIPSYAISLFFLIAVLVIGKTIYGAKSWFGFGGFGFQPSEFAKLGTILMLAYWLTYKNRDINNFKDLAVSLAIGFSPIILIMLEPDMGTSIVFALITLVMIFWSGISLFGIFVVLSPGIVVFSSIFGKAALIFTLLLVLAALFFFKKDLFNSIVIFVINLSSGFFFDYVFKILKPHQQKRIESFIDPMADPLGSGYNALQAKVAVGSGGLFGKGFLQGNQTQLRFIPQQWTDFIYCVIGEEFGFIGSVIVIVLFLILFLRLLNIANTAKDNFSVLVVVGILTLYFVHFALNIGMNLGITPVIGIPLPFLSYGGSSLIINLIMIGIVLNIYRNRKTHT